MSFSIFRFRQLCMLFAICIAMEIGGRFSFRWTMLALLALMALGSTEWLIKSLRGKRDLVELDDASDVERLRNASQKRGDLERAAFPGLEPKLHWGIRISALIALLVGAFTSLNVSLIMGVYALVLGIATTVLVVRLRNPSPMRIAVLERRRVTSALPIPWLCLGLLQAALPLTLINVPGTRMWAVISAALTFCCLPLAMITAQSPALLEGKDLPMEVFVDARLRRTRATIVMLMAVMTPLWFLTPRFGEIDRAHINLGLVTFEAGDVVWLMFMVVGALSLSMGFPMLRKLKFSQTDR